jgi:cytochrome c oxidase assembly protein subunit 15
LAGGPRFARAIDNAGVPVGHTSFQRLALWTTATTYLLILVGGLVRASGAGLGCPDWPRCFGSWIPPLSAAELPPQFDPASFNPTLMWTEYLNRLLGVAVGLFILGTTVSAWRHHRRDPHILWTTVAALALTGFQGWLGGRVVAHELAPWIVTTHLIVAIVIVQLLVYATVYSIYRRPAPAGAARRGAEATAGDRHAAAPAGTFTTVVAVLILVTLVQVTLGTQVRGGVDDALQAGVPRAGALGTVGAFDAAHRTAALGVMALALVSMLVLRAKHPGERVMAQWTYVVVALSAAQIGLGVVLAYVALAGAAQVLHLTVASLLMGAQMVQLLVAHWRT